MARSRMRGYSPEGRKRHDEGVALSLAYNDRGLRKKEELFKNVPLQDYGQSKICVSLDGPTTSEHVRHIRLQMEGEQQRRLEYSELVARGDINHRPEYIDKVCKGTANFDEMRKQTSKDNKPNVFERMLSGRDSDVSCDRVPGHSDLMNHYFADDGIHDKDGSEKVADIYLIHLTDNEVKDAGVLSDEAVYRENADGTKQVLVAKEYDERYERYDYQPITNGEYTRSQVDKVLSVVNDVMRNRYPSFELNKAKVLEGAKYADTVRRMPKNLPEAEIGSDYQR